MAESHNDAEFSAVSEQGREKFELVWGDCGNVQKAKPLIGERSDPPFAKNKTANGRPPRRIQSQNRLKALRVFHPPGRPFSSSRTQQGIWSRLAPPRILGVIRRLRVRRRFPARFGPLLCSSSRLNTRTPATAPSSSRRISPRMICADCKSPTILSASIITVILGEMSRSVRKNELTVTEEPEAIGNAALYVSSEVTQATSERYFFVLLRVFGLS